MSAPIPAYLLRDTATVWAEDLSTAYGNHWLDPVTYENVRLDTAINASETTWANEGDVTAVLFIDAVRSTPPQPPALRSRVSVVRGASTWEGTVRSVRECIDEGNHIHHWEVGLG